MKENKIILPLLEEWCRSNKQGEVTRKAALITVYLYGVILENGGLGISRRAKEQLFAILIHGSIEIKPELISIIDAIILKNKKDRRSIDYEFSQVVLSNYLKNKEIVKNIPEQVIKLAKFMWFKIDSEKDFFSNYDSEPLFGISVFSLKLLPS